MFAYRVLIFCFFDRDFRVKVVFRALLFRFYYCHHVQVRSNFRARAAREEGAVGVVAHGFHVPMERRLRAGRHVLFRLFNGLQGYPKFHAAAPHVGRYRQKGGGQLRATWPVFHELETACFQDPRCAAVSKISRYYGRIQIAVVVVVGGVEREEYSNV